MWKLVLLNTQSSVGFWLHGDVKNEERRERHVLTPFHRRLGGVNTVSRVEVQKRLTVNRMRCLSQGNRPSLGLGYSLKNVEGEEGR